jgi:hypothetical protein
MVWKGAWTFGLMLLASCSDPYSARHAVPGTLVIDRVERQLARLPCIGALDRWERHFEYGDAERTRIEFTFIEASRPPYWQRRVLRGPDLDEVSPRTAWGGYHVASGQLFLVSCGDETGALPRSRIEAFIRWRDGP